MERIGTRKDSKKILMCPTISMPCNLLLSCVNEFKIIHPCTEVIDHMVLSNNDCFQLDSLELCIKAELENSATAGKNKDRNVRKKKKSCTKTQNKIQCKNFKFLTTLTDRLEKQNCGFFEENSKSYQKIMKVFIQHFFT